MYSQNGEPLINLYVFQTIILTHIQIKLNSSLYFKPIFFLTFFANNKQ